MPINHFTDLASRTLYDINYSTEGMTTPSNNSAALKQSLLQGDPNFKVTTIDKSQFTVELSYTTYSEMLYTEYYYGYKRIKKLKNEILHQLKLRKTSAWLVVTTYYASFFAAIEIAKVLGRFNMNLDRAQQESILNKSSGGCGASFLSDSPITLIGQAAPSSEDQSIIIRFSSANGRPHKLAWDNLFYFGKTISPDKDRKIHKYQKMFIDIIGPNNRSKWPKPSDIRNVWNYSNPKYFLSYGEQITKQHKSIVGNYRKSLHWVSNRNLYPTEENQASSVAFIYTSLLTIIENLKNKILTIQ